MTFRFPRPNRFLDGFRSLRLVLRLAGKFGIGEAPAYDLANEVAEPVSIGHRQAVVVV